MSERKEFDKWCHESLIIPMGFDPVDMMWSAWQAARASRWRSMESAPTTGARFLATDSEHVTEVSFWVEEKAFGTPHWLGQTAAWHPLPDPPTKEELEKLK